MLKKDSTLYGRREAKLVSVLTSLFTSAYVLAWSRRMGEGTPLRQAPCFDGRAVAYPSDAILRDYLAWRQVDAHINNQYNTIFWALVAQGGETQTLSQIEQTRVERRQPRHVTRSEAMRIGGLAF